MDRIPHFLTHGFADEPNYLIPEGTPMPKPRDLLDRVRMECLTASAVVEAQIHFDAMRAQWKLDDMALHAQHAVDRIITDNLWTDDYLPARLIRQAFEENGL
jgi:hypothetical protein